MSKTAYQECLNRHIIKHLLMKEIIWKQDIHLLPDTDQRRIINKIENASCYMDKELEINFLGNIIKGKVVDMSVDINLSAKKHKDDIQLVINYVQGRIKVRLDNINSPEIIVK